ncbi:MAG: hypothetical protein ACAH95_00665 [Fimbriimonas sp.]
MPSYMRWNDWNGGNDAYDERIGRAPVPSVSQSNLPRVSNTLMLVTQGIDTSDWNSGGLLMESGVWWWQGAGNKIRGATIPPKWDTDSGVHDQWDGSLDNVGPYSALPRFRFNGTANVAWADGHAKAKKKGALSWCTDMFVKGGIVDPWDPGRDNSWSFNPGESCAGYEQQ